LTNTATHAVSAQTPVPEETQYVVVTAGDTAMADEVSPVLHEYEFPPVAESVVLLPAVMVVLLKAETEVLELTVTVE
jgi:hypothetical protein